MFVASTTLSPETKTYHQKITNNYCLWKNSGKKLPEVFLLIFLSTNIFDQFICLLLISANNSTTLRYLKITRYLAINRVRIVGRFGYIIRISIHVWTMIFVRVQTGLVIVIDWTRSWVFNIELRLDREHRLLRFALRTNLESVPCYAEIWSSVFTHSSLFKQSDQWGNKFNQEKNSVL